MLSPLDTIRKRVPITVYDLEWLPGSHARGLPLRLVGVYDDRGYRSFLSAEAFLGWALTPANHGRRFYAHAGGLADILFLLKHLIKDGWQCSGISSGSSMIILEVRRDRYRWVFVDSFWTLRASLADIGKSIGMPKGECEFDAPLVELEQYNRQDCRILYYALKRLEDELWELGGELKCTLASCAMNLFRRAYLKDAIVVPRNVNDTLREFYPGGRTEVYQRKVRSRGYYYDINSSYPYAMTYDLPGSYTGSGRKLKPLCWALVTAKVTGYCPALPYKSDALYFPTGTIRGWFYVDELEQSGVEILKLERAFYFESQSFMAPYVHELYQRRKATTDEFLKLIYKLIMNSLYGKFGERTDKSKVLFNPSSDWLWQTRCARMVAGEAEAPCKACKGCKLSEARKMLIPGVYTEDHEVFVPHEHIGLCGAITAIARVNLRKHMTATPRLYYCDTDSIVTDKAPAHIEPGGIETSAELGGLKFEKLFDRGDFPAPKIYLLDGELKAKGFPCKAIAEHLIAEPLRALAEDRDPDPRLPLEVIVQELDADPHKHPFVASETLRQEIFARIVNHEPLAFRSMDRVQTQLNHPSSSDGPIAIEKERQKRFHARARPKRCDTPDGNTRAWDVEELTEA